MAGIVSAAVFHRSQVYTLPPPAGHLAVIHHIATLYPYDARIGAFDWQRGFMCSDGVYRTGEDAARTAWEAGQTDHHIFYREMLPTDISPPFPGRSRSAHSEVQAAQGQEPEAV